MQIETNDYEVPVTNKNSVQLEECLCSSFIYVTNTASKGIKKHEVNEDFNYAFESDIWNDTPKDVE